MINFDIENTYFTSDLHFNHEWINSKGEVRSVILFERRECKTIEEHDNKIMNSLRNWAKNHNGATVIVLGDFGDTNYLYFVDELKYTYNIRMVFLYGNHDFKSDYDKFCEHFDEVFLYPTYIAPRVMICHEPQFPCPRGVIQLYGHLHLCEIDKQKFTQMINCNIWVNNYKPVSYKTIQKRFAKVEKASFKFLQENYVRHMVYLGPKDDAIYDKKTGKIDYEASVKLYNKNHPEHKITPIPKHHLDW